MQQEESLNLKNSISKDLDGTSRKSDFENFYFLSKDLDGTSRKSNFENFYFLSKD